MIHRDQLIDQQLAGIDDLFARLGQVQWTPERPSVGRGNPEQPSPMRGGGDFTLNQLMGSYLPAQILPFAREAQREPGPVSPCKTKSMSSSPFSGRRWRIV